MDNGIDEVLDTPKKAADEGGPAVYVQYANDSGQHPTSHADWECAFAASAMSWVLRKKKRPYVLNIGSYTQFIYGLASRCVIYSVDIRDRPAQVVNEITFKAEATAMPMFPSGFFPFAICLCSLEHFGLGRYGDADHQALREIHRVLQPGGKLILTTTIGQKPSILYNTHRVYDYKRLSWLRNVCGFQSFGPERFFSVSGGKEIQHEEVTAEPIGYDIYGGVWRKR